MSDIQELIIRKGPDPLELARALLGPKGENDSFPYPSPARQTYPKAVFEAGGDPSRSSVLQVTVLGVRDTDNQGHTFEIQGTARYWNDAPMGHGGPTLSDKPLPVLITYDIQSKTGVVRISK